MATKLELKSKGNEAFKNHKYNEAKDLYSKAIEIDLSDGNLYSNLALVNAKLELFGESIRDATKAIELGQFKGYYRRASAYLSLGKLILAKKDFFAAHKVFPSNSDIQRQLDFCKMEIRKRNFAEAIKNDLSVPLSERIDLNSVAKSEEEYDVIFPLNEENVKSIKEEFISQKLIQKRSAYKIVLEAMKVFRQEPTLIKTDIPENATFNIFGDVHGQYYDLVNIFEINGYPSSSNFYLFNGDFVDRGLFSAECALLLFCYKILYPRSFFINRGNHEAMSMNCVHGFRNEVIGKYDGNLYELFSEAFQCLPLCHQLGNKALILHGGLFSKDKVSLKNLAEIKRFREPADSDLMSELLWSDPCEQDGRHMSRRGAGINFGGDVLREFLDYNGLEMLIRSHEMKMEGVESMFGGRLMTVFSAPNYCDTVGNKGAFIKFDSDYSFETKKFAHVLHPSARRY